MTTDNHLPNYVKRSLHAVSRANDHVNYLQLVAIYSNAPGEVYERFEQVKRYASGEPQEQQRKAQADGVQFRSAEMRASSDSLVVEGYAAVFDRVATIGGAFKERIAKGAFSDVLDNDVRFLVNHEGMPLARTSNGTMTLKEDDKGLYYRATLSDTQMGRDVYTSIQRGDMSQSSFAFTVEQESIDEDGVRVIEKVRQLIDTSAVSYPAYSEATVSARSGKK